MLLVNLFRMQRAVFYDSPSLSTVYERYCIDFPRNLLLLQKGLVFLVRL